MKYAKYKPTGIFWQPEIPSNWNIRKLRYVLKKLDREKRESAELLVCTNKGKVVKRGDAKIGLVSDDESIYQGVAKGDLLIHGMDTWHGAVAVSELDGMCTPVVHVCDSTEDKKYIAYYLRNMARGKLFKLISNGVRQNTSDFRSWEKLARLPIPLPPLATQRAMVAFLDEKCGKIDRLVVAKEKTATLLKELRERVIADAVTKGVDGSRPMRPSGIAWLPEVPKGWEVRRAASFLKVKDAPSAPEEELLSVFLDRGVIRFSEGGEKRANATSKDLSKYQLVEPDDFVMNNQQAWRGSVGVSPYRGIVSPAYFVVQLGDCINPKYANMAFRSKPFVSVFELCSRGVGSIQRNLVWNMFKQQHLPLPTLSEQQKIVAYIEAKTAKIDAAVSGLEREIEALKEYKQSLVAEVVTGQRKVG